jgi:hypothetical protein
LTEFRGDIELNDLLFNLIETLSKRQSSERTS